MHSPSSGNLPESAACRENWPPVSGAEGIHAFSGGRKLETDADSFKKESVADVSWDPEQGAADWDTASIAAGPYCKSQSREVRCTDLWQAEELDWSAVGCFEL
jgi:hypothetical protein